MVSEQWLSFKLLTHLQSLTSSTPNPSLIPVYPLPPGSSHIDLVVIPPRGQVPFSARASPRATPPLHKLIHGLIPTQQSGLGSRPPPPRLATTRCLLPEKPSFGLNSYLCSASNLGTETATPAQSLAQQALSDSLLSGFCWDANKGESEGGTVQVITR